MVMRRPGGGNWVPSVGRVNITGLILVDLTLSNCAQAIVVTAERLRACRFQSADGVSSQVLFRR